MTVCWRIAIGLALAALPALGCRSTTSHIQKPVQPLAPPPPPPTLQATTAVSLEPDYRNLPKIEPLSSAPEEVAPRPQGFLALTEEICWQEASARASISGLFIRENRIPPRRTERGFTVAADNLIREVRIHLAAEGRNRAAADALDEFYQLADAEGRGDLLRAVIPILDRLRATVRMARAEGVRVPVDPDDLDRQRASLLGLIVQADLGAEGLDIDLKRRIGYPGDSRERLRPIGAFGVSADAIDVESAIETALEKRADIKALRSAYEQLTPENLPIIREMLRGALGKGSSAVGNNETVLGAALRPTMLVLMTRIHSKQLDAAVESEIKIRRQQLADLITERERQTADEIRATAANLSAQAVQVAIARWRVEQLTRELKEAKDRGPLAELPAEIELLRARADVIAAVMNWHRARVKFNSVQGFYEGPEVPIPPATAPKTKRLK